ncbi:MAG: hypothetical protein IIA88_07355 [Bacteroidetes bacterium]|nr:hypothetical protein [Bacteroidota bacterium]
MKSIKIIIGFYFLHLINNQIGFSQECPVVGGDNISVATKIQEVYELEECIDEYLFKKAEKIYLNILQQDSMNEVANYSLGSLYYNRGVYRSNYIQKEVDSLTVEESEKILSEIYLYMKKSKLYLERTYDIMK